MINTTKSRIIPAGFYPDGAIAFEIKGELVILSGGGDDGNFNLWFSTIPATDEGFEQILNQEGELDHLGAGFAGPFNEMLENISLALNGKL